MVAEQYLENDTVTDTYEITLQTCHSSKADFEKMNNKINTLLNNIKKNTDQNLTIHCYIPGSNLMLELDSILYIGGVPRDMYSSLPVGVLSRQGFEGCMSSLDLPGESPSLLEDAVVPSSSLVSGCEGLFKFLHAFI